LGTANIRKTYFFASILAHFLVIIYLIADFQTKIPQIALARAFVGRLFGA
jgi:hypothetical protein